MTDRHADVIVVGLGAMGSATVDELAGRGHSVVGLEAFGPGHTNGSSHGPTRFIRRVIEEDPLYVPLAVDAIDRWAALEDDTATELFVRNGVLRLGPPDADLLQSFRASADAWSLGYEEFSPGELHQRFDPLRAPDGFVGLLEREAGTVYADRALATLQARARRRGAELRFDEPVDSWSADGDSVSVTTRSTTYHAHRLVVTAGPWTGKVVTDPPLPFEIHRLVNVSFAVDEDRCGVGRMPALLVVDGDTGAGTGTTVVRSDSFYAIPAVPGEGFKTGTAGGVVDPDRVDRAVTDADVAGLRLRFDRFLPGGVGPVTSTSTCLSTNTPDEHFVIDIHPAHNNVVVASPCSGHGFKYTPTIGAILTDLATEVTPGHDLSPFRIDRFG